MRFSRLRPFFASSLFALVACSSSPEADPPGTSSGQATDAPPPAPPAPPPVSALAWKPCTLEPDAKGGGTGDAECAITEAPLDHAAPGGRTIELGVKRVVQGPKAKAQLWLVHGGPGASAVAGLADLARQIRTERPEVELYAVDHRGVGGSHALVCPAPGSDMVACAAHLSATEGDVLPHVTTSNAMRDLAMLVERTRKPGVPVYVFGGSYGTYAVLRYMALFPKQADAVILEGISPPGRGFDTYDEEMNGAAEKLFARCKEDASCTSRLGPDPWAAAGDVVASFGKGHCPTLNLDPDGARAFLGAYSLYREFRDLLPAIVFRMKRCETRDIAPIVQFYRAMRGGAATPLGMTFNDARHAQSTALFFHIALSEMWHPGGLPDEQDVVARWRQTTMSTGLTVSLVRQQRTWPVYARGPEVSSDLPSFERPLLMLQGELDTATAAPAARRLRDGYKAPNQTWVEVPFAAHSVMEGSPMRAGGDCARRIVLGFLDDPKAPVDTSCTADVLPPQFDGVPALNKILLGVSDAWDG